MPNIGATDKEKRELAMKGYSEPVILPGAEGPPKITYHNPKTGQQFDNLPADSYNLMHYIGRGLAVGPAPIELKAEFDAKAKEEVGNTISATELPPELQQLNPDGQKLIEEVAELKEMVKMLVIAQMGDKAPTAPSVPKKKKRGKGKQKSVTIETEEEMNIPYDTQLGLII